MILPGCSILTHNNQLSIILPLQKLPGAMKNKSSWYKTSFRKNIQIVWIILQKLHLFQFAEHLSLSLGPNSITQLNLFPLGASHHKLAIRWPYEHFSIFPVQFTSTGISRLFTSKMKALSMPKQSAYAYGDWNATTDKSSIQNLQKFNFSEWMGLFDNRIIKNCVDSVGFRRR